MMWFPRIDRTLCIGCEQCVQACPTNALAQIELKALVVRPEACTYCGDCETICPTQAIELPYLICFALSNKQDVN